MQRCHSLTELSKDEKERVGFRSTAAGCPEELGVSKARFDGALSDQSGVWHPWQQGGMG